MIKKLFADTPDIGRHEMRIMDPVKGDLKSTWDPDNEDEVEAAEEMFDAQRKRGMAAYRVNKKGKKTEVMTEFDKDANAIIFAPPPKGG